MVGRECILELIPWDGEKGWEGNGLNIRHGGGSGKRAPLD
jgi:hypothetical protein